MTEARRQSRLRTCVWSGLKSCLGFDQEGPSCSERTYGTMEEATGLFSRSSTDAALVSPRMIGWGCLFSTPDPTLLDTLGGDDQQSGDRSCNARLRIHRENHRRMTMTFRHWLPLAARFRVRKERLFLILGCAKCRVALRNWFRRLRVRRVSR
jgi:hypothetical protein